MRDLDKIDHELSHERVIWLYEARAGRASEEAQAACRRIDKLLDERSDVVRSLPSSAPSPVDAGLVPGQAR